MTQLGPFNSWGRERYWDLAWSHGPGMAGVFPSIHAAGDVQMDITAPVLLRSNLLAHGPQSSDCKCSRSLCPFFRASKKRLRRCLCRPGRRQLEHHHERQYNDRVRDEEPR